MSRDMQAGMSRSMRQLFHVGKFDLLRLRWWYAAIVSVFGLLLSTVIFDNGMSNTLLDSPEMVTSALLLVLVLFGAALVHGDRPSDQRNFIQSVPLSRRGRALAKLAPVVLLAAIVVSTALLMLLYQDVPFGDALDDLQKPVLVFAGMLSMALLVGTLTRGTGTALLLVIVTVVGTAVIVMLFDFAPFSPRARWLFGRWPGQSVMLSLLTIGAVTLFVWCYTRPAWLKHERVVSCAVLILGNMLLTRAASTGGGKPTQDDVERFDVLSERVRFAAFPDSVGEQVDLPYSIESARPDRIYALNRVWVSWSGLRTQLQRQREFNSGIPGATVRARNPAAGAAAFDLAYGKRWLQTTGSRSAATFDSGALSGDFRAFSTLQRVDSVHIDVALTRYRARRIAVVPFRLGTLFVNNGDRAWLVRNEDGLFVNWTSFRDVVLSPFQRGVLQTPLDVYYALVVVDSLSNSARLLQYRSSRDDSQLSVLPSLSRTLFSEEVRDAEALQELLDRPRPASIAVYEWVADGIGTIRESRAVDGWPNNRARQSSSVVWRAPLNR